jgi:hypothetical protein
MDGDEWLFNIEMAECEAEENAAIDRYFRSGKPASLAKEIWDKYCIDVTDPEEEVIWRS